MKLSTKMLALGVGAVLTLGGCDRGDRATDAGDARNEADAGRAEAQARASLPGNEGGADTLAMSGTPSSHLVDGAGSALYVLAGNMDGSLCDAACQEAWPPVLAHDARPTAGTGVEAGSIGTLERDGRTHVTYAGQPLYRYAGDAGAGRTAGHGVDDQWGSWSLVGLDGQPVKAQPESAQE